LVKEFVESANSLPDLVKKFADWRNYFGKFSNCIAFLPNWASKTAKKSATEANRLLSEVSQVGVTRE
jgi:hypothetical protein